MLVAWGYQEEHWYVHVVWLEEAEGGSFCPVWCAKGYPGVHDTPVGENSPRCMPRWMEQRPLCRPWSSTAAARLCGAERNGCGGALRKACTPYRVQPACGAEPHTWLD
jgi:hypothetical protein